MAALPSTSEATQTTYAMVSSARSTGIAVLVAVTMTIAAMTATTPLPGFGGPYPSPYSSVALSRLLQVREGDV